METNLLNQLKQQIALLTPGEKQDLAAFLSNQLREARERERGEVARRQAASHQQAMAWLANHQAEYLNQWVALDGDRLISYGPDGGKVYDEAKAAGVEVPFLIHVVEEPEPFYAGW